LETQLRRTLRRRGSGMLRKLLMEQGRPLKVDALSVVTFDIRKVPKFKGKLLEESEEAIVLMIVETTQLDRKEGPLLQPGQARR